MVLSDNVHTIVKNGKLLKRGNSLPTRSSERARTHTHKHTRAQQVDLMSQLLSP